MRYPIHPKNSVHIIFMLLVFTQTLNLYGLEVTEKHRQVANSKKWHKLMHYKPNFWGGVESQLDGRGFFFAKDGATNPLSELLATIEAGTKNIELGHLKQSPRCAFPARYKFISEQFEISYQKLKCDKYDEFIGHFNDAKSVSLVFSSAYPNNPASMFGHTFLKINTHKGSDLINKGINFAAYAGDNENFLKFAAYGIFGGYLGKWSSQPYYVKVNEYVNFENRDLWEYELALNEEETKELLAHFWELETNSHFKYYFFDENCSYQILAAIEAVKPNWEILQHTIYMIPGESVKNLALQQGMVKKVKYRPSLYNITHSKFYSLNLEDREIFKELIENKKPITEVQSFPVVETARYYLEYKRNDEKQSFETEYGSLRKSLLSYIASRKVKRSAAVEEAVLRHSTRPDFGHDSYSFYLGYGTEGVQENFQPFTTIKIKSAYHDLLNNDTGYTEYAHIDFPYIELRHSAKNNLSVEEVGIIAATSLHPFTFIEKKKSWKFKVSAEKAKDYGCENCLNGIFEYGAGLTFSFTETKEHLFYLLANARVELNGSFERGYRLGPGLETGILLKPFSKYKIHLNYKFQSDLWQNLRAPGYNKFQWAHSYAIKRNWEIRNTNEYIVSTVDNKSFEYLDSRVNLIYFFR